MSLSSQPEPADNNPAPLGKPLHSEFSGKSAPNRFMKAAMTERYSSWDAEDFEARGIPSENLIRVYERWVEGGFGVILTGNTMIEFDQLEAAGNLIIPRGAKFEGERFDQFTKLAVQAKKHDSLIMSQISHPGRQTQDTLQPHPISASDVRLEGPVMGMTFAKPRPATEEDIKNVIESFAHAAEFLDKAGYDGIEIHGAHGYLLAQFISPTTNHRADKYGGSLENRARIVLDIAQEIRRRTRPDFVVGIKLNSVEFQEKGFDTDEAKHLCQMLEAYRIDFVELSGGTYEKLAFNHQRESTRKREAFFLDFAEMIVPSLTKTKTYITGGLRSVGAMLKALDVVDGIGLARPVCQEPSLCKKILEGKTMSAVEQDIDQSNFGLTNIAAGTQIRQIGQNFEPIDLTKKENVEAFMKDMEVWNKKMAEDSKGVHYGYLDIESAVRIPYGV